MGGFKDRRIRFGMAYFCRNDHIPEEGREIMTFENSMQPTIEVGENEEEEVWSIPLEELEDFSGFGVRDPLGGVRVVSVEGLEVVVSGAGGDAIFGVEGFEKALHEALPPASAIVNGGTAGALRGMGFPLLSEFGFSGGRVEGESVALGDRCVSLPNALSKSEEGADCIKGNCTYGIDGHRFVAVF